MEREWKNEYPEKALKEDYSDIELVKIRHLKHGMPCQQCPCGADNEQELVNAERYERIFIESLLGCGSFGIPCSRTF